MLFFPVSQAAALALGLDVCVCVVGCGGGTSKPLSFLDLAPKDFWLFQSTNGPSEHICYPETVQRMCSRQCPQTHAMLPVQAQESLLKGLRGG